MSLLDHAEADMEEKNEAARRQRKINNLLIKITFFLNLVSASLLVLITTFTRGPSTLYTLPFSFNPGDATGT